MSELPIRVGVVGAGSSAVKTHIPRFQGIEGVEVVSVSNRTHQSAQRAADSLGIPKVYDHWPDLVASDEINAVFIGTWPYLHKPVTIAALETGKHVLSQSRMAMNAQEARDMLDVSRRHPGLVTGLVPTSRLSTGLETLRRLISDGWLGDLLSIEIVSGSDFLDPDAPFFWRLDREVSGVNTLEIGMLCEALDRVVGPFSTVMANAKVNVPWRRDATGEPRVVTVPDHVDIIGEMAVGASYHMRFSQVTGMAEEGVWFYGSEGTLKSDGYAERLFGARRGEREFTEIEVPPRPQIVHDIAAEFVSAIREQRQVEQVTFEQGVRYMEFTEAVGISARTGRRIHLPSPSVIPA